jgi:hypothetical protein
VVGSVDPDLLGSAQHLKDYLPEDYVLLEDFLSNFKHIVITAHVATEAAHFIGKLGKTGRPELKAAFSTALTAIVERAIRTKIAASRAEFQWLDLSDCSVLEAAKPHDVVLSTDAQLVDRRLQLGYEAVNFNHLRQAAGLL